MLAHMSISERIAAQWRGSTDYKNGGISPWAYEMEGRRMSGEMAATLHCQKQHVMITEAIKIVHNSFSCSLPKEGTSSHDAPAHCAVQHLTAGRLHKIQNLCLPQASTCLTSRSSLE